MVLCVSESQTLKLVSEGELGEQVGVLIIEGVNDSQLVVDGEEDLPRHLCQWNLPKEVALLLALDEFVNFLDCSWYVIGVGEHRLLYVAIL